MRPLAVFAFALFLVGFVEDPRPRGALPIPLEKSPNPARIDIDCQTEFCLYSSVRIPVATAERSLLASFWPAASVARTLVSSEILHGDKIERLHVLVADGRDVAAKQRIILHVKLPPGAFDTGAALVREQARGPVLEPDACSRVRGTHRFLPSVLKDGVLTVMARGGGADYIAVCYSTGAHVDDAIAIGPFVARGANRSRHEWFTRFGVQGGFGFTKDPFPRGTLWTASFGTERFGAGATGLPPRYYAMVEATTPWLAYVPSVSVGFAILYDTLQGKPFPRYTAAWHWAGLGLRWDWDKRDGYESSFALAVGF